MTPHGRSRVWLAASRPWCAAGKGKTVTNDQDADAAADIAAWITQARNCDAPAIATFAAGLEADIAAVMEAHNAFGEAAGKAGVLLGGEALQLSNTATVVQVRDGERMLTDGPFAETKEQLGGYYVLQCKDLDEALTWAAQIPEAKSGKVEVRPIMEFEGM